MWMETTLDIGTNLARGGILSCLTLLLTAALEWTCRDHVHKFITSKPNGKALYQQAWIANVFNVPVFGALTYHCTMMAIVSSNGGGTPSATKSVGEQAMAVLGIVVIEGVMYTLIHKAFHEVPGLYWIHKFHHKFNDIVLPSSANAVSMTEFVVAYMIPILTGAYLMDADEISAVLGATFIAIPNLLIHTPALVDHYHLPWFGVSTQDHLNHHKRLTSDYAAPLIHFDRLWERASVVSQKDHVKNI